jgi:pyridoxamine 5'-phosphate oxidase
VSSRDSENAEVTIRESRISYEKDTLVEARVASDPLAQFRSWLGEALETPGVVEPNAMTVASVGNDGRPSLRVVLLRGYDERGFVFFTNYESRKGRELDAHPGAALLFYWAAMERQIRIEGSTARLEPNESDEYFMQRPRGHRLSAWASKQSSIVPDRAFLEMEMAREEERFKGVEVGRPAYWGGYRITPAYYEFWQGRRNRVHDRIAYERTGSEWKRYRLSP